MKLTKNEYDGLNIRLDALQDCVELLTPYELENEHPEKYPLTHKQGNRISLRIQELKNYIYNNKKIEETTPKVTINPKK